MQCFHWITVKGRKKKGGGREPDKKKKVITWKADKHMKINTYYDRSPPCYTLSYLDRIHVTRLDTEKIIELSPKATNIRDTLKKEFI